MKKKIVLKRLFHRNEWRYAVLFEYDRKLIGLVRSIKSSRWSQTNDCWYTDCNEETLKQILTTFRESADIDISAIASGGENKEMYQAGTTDSKEDQTSDNEDLFSDDSPPPQATKAIDTEKESSRHFGPVKFSINEADGRLVIKFLGKYDPAWIKELKSFGRVQYDSSKKEWLLRWSQIAVDSLSDYFTTTGITVIIVKQELSPAIKGKRIEEGGEVRDRILSKSSMDGLESVRRYLEEKRYSMRTISSYMANLELFFKFFAEKEPADINEEDISLFVNKYILRLGYSASYQNLTISAIKIYYSLSEKRTLNLDSIERPRRSRPLPKVLSKEEVLKIFSATRNNKHKLILWLIYSCGLRRSEVINIKLTDLDSERGVLNIRQGKGNVDRIVPVPDKVWEKIRSYLKGHKPAGYLFEGQSGGKYSVESVYSIFKQSLRRAGIRKDVGVHSLRHSYATHLHESGLDIRYIQELLGHKSSRTTEIYTHISRRNLFAIRSPIEDMDIG